MSAFCLGLAGPVSAPPELDSACRMELPGTPPAAAGAKDDRCSAPSAAAPAASSAASAGGSGELELALEEELALLAAAGEPVAEPEPQGPAVPERELLSLMRQKEKDLMLAARLGKALLERNQDMSRQYEKMHKELTDKLEVRRPGRGKRKRKPLGLERGVACMTQVGLGPPALPSHAR